MKTSKIRQEFKVKFNNVTSQKSKGGKEMKKVMVKSALLLVIFQLFLLSALRIRWSS